MIGALSYNCKLRSRICVMDLAHFFSVVMRLIFPLLDLIHPGALPTNFVCAASGMTGLVGAGRTGDGERDTSPSSLSAVAGILLGPATFDGSDGKPAVADLAVVVAVDVDFGTAARLVARRSR